MNDDQDKQPAQTDAELEREIREARKFDPKEALARRAGPGAMKGASPVSRLQQAEAEIGNWLKCHVDDVAGALPAVLQRHLKGSQLLLENLDQPLAALARFCERILDSDLLLKELVREADVEWGQRMDERPYFQREGAPQHPADPYTAESVRGAVGEALNALRSRSTAR
jgi:hypothetical protein